MLHAEDDEGVKKIIDIFNYKQRLLNIDMKTKVVQHVPRIIFNVFKVFKFSSFQVFRFSKFSGSQRLSDFQTFFSIYQQYNEKHAKNIDMECCVTFPSIHFQ